MRFKEGDRVTTHYGISNCNSGVVRATFRDEFREGEPKEVVVVRMDGGYLETLSAEQLEREPRKFYIEGDMCPGAAGDVPVILAGPQGMIKNFSEGMEEYFEAEYDPTRGDNYHVTITVELVRGD